MSMPIHAGIKCLFGLSTTYTPAYAQFRIVVNILLKICTGCSLCPLCKSTISPLFDFKRELAGAGKYLYTVNIH
jgi:hypothetical protein